MGRIRGAFAWIGRVFSPRPPAPAPPEDLLHLMTPGRTVVLCGDRLASRWTIEVGQETCPPCRQRGRMISIRRQTNDR